jgi:hypothetical protein
MPLAEAKKKLGEVLVKMQDGVYGAEDEFDELLQIIKNHPDQIKEVAAKKKIWEEEQKPLCENALLRMRAVIPPQIFDATIEQLQKMGLNKALATRLSRTKILRLIRTGTYTLKSSSV